MIQCPHMCVDEETSHQCFLPRYHGNWHAYVDADGKVVEWYNNVNIRQIGGVA